MSRSSHRVLQAAVVALGVAVPLPAYAACRDTLLTGRSRVASGSRDDLPPLTDDVLAVADTLRRGLDRVLGDAGASLFLYGAAAFPRPAGWRIDFDFHVLVLRSLTDRDRRAIRDLYAELGAASQLGADLDGYFVLVADASRAEPPRHQLDLGIRDHAWALHRAHVHAGRYFLMAGLDPREIVPEPTWAELETGLRHELQFVEAHPAATAFGILNAGARPVQLRDTRRRAVEVPGRSVGTRLAPARVARGHRRRVTLVPRGPHPTPTSRRSRRTGPHFSRFVKHSIGRTR